MGLDQERNPISIKLQKEELICGYNSGTFKPNEQKYIIFEKELLAIKFGNKKFSYLLSSRKFYCMY